MNRSIGIITLLFGWSTYAWSDDTATLQAPLTLKQALEQALMHNVDLHLEDKQLRRTQAQVGEARAAFWPSLDLVAQVQRTTNYDTFSGVEVVIDGRPVNTTVLVDVPKYEAGAALEGLFNLYSGGASTARLREAQANVAAAEGQAGLTRERIIKVVIQAYWQLRKAQISFDRKRMALELAEEEARLAEARLQGGTISEFERGTKTLRVTEARLLLLEAEQQRSFEWQEYRAALGMTPLPTNAQSETALVDDPDRVDLNALVGDVEKSQPALRQAQAKYEAARLRHARTRAEYGPSIDLYGRYREIGRSNTALNDSISDVHRQDWAVGLRLRWNIFGGFQTSERLVRAQEESDIERLHVERLQREQFNDVQNKILHVELSKSRLSLAQNRLDVSEAQLRIAARRLDLNQITNLQYKTEQLTLHEAKDVLLFAKVDLLLSRLGLMLAQRGDQVQRWLEPGNLINGKWHR